MLSSESSSVRSQACFAFEKMGENVATKEVIEGVMSLLHDKVEWVQRGACSTVMKIDGNVTSKEVVSCLNRLLNSRDYMAYREAYRMIMNMGGKAATKEVIDALVSALRDQKRFSEEEICKTLEKIGEEAGWNMILVSLVEAFEKAEISNSGWFLREIINKAMSSSDSFKNMKTTTIMNLISLCRKNWDIKWKAIPRDSFIKAFLISGDNAWLPLIKHAAFIQSAAITVMTDKILIYDNENIISLEVSDNDLLNVFSTGMKLKTNESELDIMRICRH